MPATDTYQTASEAKSAIHDLADVYSWETIARELVAQMTGDDAREFLHYFNSNSCYY